jgi:hypothetical protein
VRVSAENERAGSLEAFRMQWRRHASRWTCYVRDQPRSLLKPFSVIGLRPGRSRQLPLSSIFCHTESHEEINKGATEKDARRSGDWSRSSRHVANASCSDCRG